MIKGIINSIKPSEKKRQDAVNKKARKDLEKDLEKKLQEIPDNYRIILLMKYKEDFSLQEIAEILKLPYNTVKSQHARALASLKKVIHPVKFFWWKTTGQADK